MSRSRADERLSPELLDYLRAPHPLVVITLAPDGRPSADVVSWALAPDDATVRLVIGSQRPSVANVRANGILAVQVLGRELAYEIKGAARIIKERCQSIRFPQTMVELHVDSVRENMYPANSITGDVPVCWPESTRTHHAAWDAAVVEEMRHG